MATSEFLQLPSRAPSNRRRAEARRAGRRRCFRLRIEQLEPRRLLAGDFSDSWSWFKTFSDVPRIAPNELAAESDIDSDAIGPHDLVASEWIVQLSDVATDSIASLDRVNELLDRDPVDLTIISGLGSPGLVLIRGRGVTDADVREVLESSREVASFGANGLIQGQAVPNDPELQAGLLPGLDQINAPQAWDDTRGSPTVVVGVVDGGIDAAHPDLFLNIWLNQGEIPSGLRDQLIDTDGDGLITFYDLNNFRVSESGIEVASTGVLATQTELTLQTPFSTGANAGLVDDKNGNGRIDAIDLLFDVNWADGRDTDGNSFFDDLFGVNFRAGNGDPFPSNQPLDELGHGTHVSGTIGAIGNNNFGITGVNWQTSLMSLRILDNNNQSDASAAIRAVNYARQMRADLVTSDSGEVESGANVRVLNNSWGQPGGFDKALQSAIAESGDQGILFVAAAGNGNILGNGVDNDETAFYPASYEVDNLIAVAALSPTGTSLATFSNFGASSVDVGAPGVGVRSTLPGGGFGPANGTSMATPHVSGTAALIWSALPEATVAEVRAAIIGTVDSFSGGNNVLSTGGRLNAGAAINADVFAPAARLIAKQNITTAGGVSTEFTVVYRHRSGIDSATIGDDDIIVTRQWGPPTTIPATVTQLGQPQADGSVSVTYKIDAPGGSWDPLDFGGYAISTVAGSIAADSGDRSQSRDVGSFNVKIDDPTVLYVDSLGDARDQDSLRDAIITANAAGQQRTIILDSGTYKIEIPHETDPSSAFVTTDPALFCSSPDHLTGWSNETSGDFDITGSVTIIGNRNELTVIDARGLDRVFKVHDGASLDLSRLTVTGGVSPSDQGGGGILSRGELSLDDVIVRGNNALSFDADNPTRGGGIALWSGTATIRGSWITDNASDFGGGLFLCGIADGSIRRSTLSENRGGGLQSHSDRDLTIENSTFSGNVGGLGAIFQGKRDGFGISNGLSQSPALSSNGRFLVFESFASNLVRGGVDGISNLYVVDLQTSKLEPVDISEINVTQEPSISNDGNVVAFQSFGGGVDPNFVDRIFVHDRSTDQTETVSVASDGSLPNQRSRAPVISGDGRFVAFESFATNLAPNVNGDGMTNIYLYDRTSDTTELVSHNLAGGGGNGFSSRPIVSDDGRFVAFDSSASDLVSGDNNARTDIFLYDRLTADITRVSVDGSGGESNGSSSLNGPGSLSPDGRFLAFTSQASNLVAGDTNGSKDVFVYDQSDGSVERVSVRDDGGEVSGTFFLNSLTVSADGRFVSFISDADNLIDGDTDGEVDRFVRDRQTQTIEQLDPLSRFFGPLSRDANVAVFTVFQNDLIPGDTNDQPDIFIFDVPSATLSSPTIIDPTTSSTSATQVTVTGTTGSPFAVAGSVVLSDVLLTNNENDIDTAVQTSSTVVTTSDAGSNLIDPLTQFNGQPPVHPILRGNPAIDNGDPNLSGTVDQLGNLRTVPDIGAFEAVSGSISGSVYVDLNENQVRNVGEPGVDGITVTANDLNQSNDPLERVSESDDLGTVDRDETGLISFANVPASDYLFQVDVPPNWILSVPKIQQVTPPTTNANIISANPVLSNDGQIVAFGSDANKLSVGDDDVFAFDRRRDVYELISRNDAGGPDLLISDRPSISADGRLIAFDSVTNIPPPLGPSQNNDIYLYDRDADAISIVGNDISGQKFSPELSSDGLYVAFVKDGELYLHEIASGTSELVSMRPDGQPSGDSAQAPTINTDGTLVAFVSRASDFGVTDTNGVSDIYVFNRVTKQIERVSIAQPNVEPDGASDSPALSDDGRFVAFSSAATNLVGQDNNNVTDVFVKDLLTGTVELISRTVGGTAGNGDSSAPSISADGRYVVYQSFADNLVLDDNNELPDVFVYDRQDDRIARVSVDQNGIEADLLSFSPSISGDGSTIAFLSFAEFSPQENRGLSVFVTPNPLVDTAVKRTTLPGDRISDLDFGLIPDPGVISGRLFQDTVPNQRFDPGESSLSDWTVFLDTNRNRTLDDGELLAKTDSDGGFVFDQAPSFRTHQIAVQIPSGWEQVFPDEANGFTHDIFLPPGGTVSGRDFGFRRVTGTAQSTGSSVSGRIFDDQNSNGVFDSGVDIPLPNTVVYLDTQNFGVRDVNEAAVETDANGNYSIANLGASIVAVSTQLDERTIHASPLGSSFQLAKFPLFEEIAPFGNPQAIVTADFNQDTFPDVAIALSESNTISIRLNDGQGGFLPDQIDIDLGDDGGGPTSLVVGQFNGAGTPLDLAVTNNFKSNVVVLRDFNGSGFDLKQTVVVGGPTSDSQPLDIAAAVIADTSDPNRLDIFVVNKADNSVQLLLNDGSGLFSAQSPIASGGIAPVAVVAADLTGDGFTDIAVVHAAPSAGTPSGDVRILAGDGLGGFVLTPIRYEVGATPTDMVAADFDGDGRLDLAVANFASNSISILTGNLDGTLTVQAQTLGTASGAFDITSGDIDNDGDTDIIASNLLDRNVSIFRNTTLTPGVTVFQPLEAVGLGQFGIAQRMPLAVANFDQDSSAPSGQGTLDVVAIPRLTDTLHVLTNRLVNGAHRVELTGLNQVVGLDFFVTPAKLAPKLDPIPDPFPMDEDASEKTITLSGIAKGRLGGPPLRFSALSSDPTLVNDPTVSHIDGQSTAVLTYAPNANVNGVATINVTATDAGADQVFDTADDVALNRPFTAVVLRVNDPPAFSFSSDVVSVDENSGDQSIAGFVVGISPGGGTDEASQSLSDFVVTTNFSLFSAGPAIDRQGRLTFTPLADRSGTAQVSVRLSDDGGTANEGLDASSATFAITMLPVDPQSIVLTGSGNTFFLTQPDSQLDGVQLIDIRGSGDNLLVLDASRIRSAFANGSIIVLSNSGDAVQFDAGWQFDQALLDAGTLVRRFVNDGAELSLVGPDDFTNPINMFDVDASGNVSSLDALQIINELRRRLFSSSQTTPIGRVRDVTTIDLSQFRFYDVSGDLRITALDALRVINQLARQRNSDNP